MFELYLSWVPLHHFVIRNCYMCVISLRQMIVVIVPFHREVHEEVNQAREKASELKLRRQEQAATRREKLRQAYLKKRLENLKAASNAEQTWSAQGKDHIVLLVAIDLTRSRCLFLTFISWWKMHWNSLHPSMYFFLVTFLFVYSKVVYSMNYMMKVTYLNAHCRPFRL